MSAANVSHSASAVTARVDSKVRQQGSTARVDGKDNTLLQMQICASLLCSKSARFTVCCVHRLYKGRDDLELEWTVGPLTEGMDIVLRLSSDLDSGKILQIDACSKGPGTHLHLPPSSLDSKTLRPYTLPVIC